MTLGRQAVSPWTLLALTIASESAVVLGGAHVVGPIGLVLVLVATAAWALLVSDPRLEQHLRLVVVAIAIAFAVALTVEPQGSHDIWSYVMGGRAISAHHVSPYVHPPGDFPHDPFLARVGRGWRQTVSVYGPLFSAVSAVFTRAAGTSVLGARLAFQGLAAAGVGTALVLVWRSTRSVRAVAFLGLHPAVVTAIVNGAHNDGLVGLAVLAGVLLAERGRWSGAGIAVGLGILVKASGVLGLVGLAAWGLARDRRGAAKLVVVAAATTVAGYLPAGFVAVRAAAKAGDGINRNSVWEPLSLLTSHAEIVALVCVAAFVVFAAWRRRRAREPAATAVATTAAYLLAGPFLLPWYPAWALPSAAIEGGSRLSALVAAHAAFFVAAYELELPGHTTLTGAAAVVRQVVVFTAVLVALAVFVASLVRPAHDPTPGDRGPHGTQGESADYPPASFARRAHRAPSPLQ